MFHLLWKKVKAFKQDLLKICLHIKEEYFQEKSTFFDKEICTSPKQHGNNLCDFKIQNSLSVCYLSIYHHLSLSVYYSISDLGFTSLLMIERGFGKNGE